MASVRGGKRSGRGDGAPAAEGGTLNARATTLLAGLPGAVVSWKFHNASFSVGGKVFGFTRGASVVCKLPGERVEELVTRGTGAALVMGKRTMKEWAVVQAADEAQELELLREAMEFVRVK